MVKSVKRKS